MPYYELKKRKRKVLAIDDKLKIIDDLGKGLSNIAQVSSQYGIGKQTVRDIWRKKDDLMSFAATINCENTIKTRKVMSTSSYEKLDKEMLDWFKIQKGTNKTITETSLIRKVKATCQLLNIEDSFNFNKWFKRFQKRYEVNMRNGDEIDEDMTVEPILIEGEPVVNLNDVLIFPPDNDLSSNHSSNKTDDGDNKESITILSNVSESGNQNFRLVLLGKTKVNKMEKGNFIKWLSNNEIDGNELEFANSILNIEKNISNKSAASHAELLLKYLEQENYPQEDKNFLQRLTYSIKEKDVSV